jgi:glycosyltransferase involved in cell wall biosynthesis/SAM-dependent methyltransferase
MQAIIFSKDRPLQLDMTLRSFMLHCLDFNQVSVRIIVKASNELYNHAYHSIENEYLAYNNISLISETDFRQQVIDLLRFDEFVLWLVDDNIFVRDFYISNCQQLLETNQDTIGYSLRLGKNTTYCYPLDKQQTIPDFHKLSETTYKYKWSTAEFDFGYPLEVSSSLYRTRDLLPLLESINFYNPNSLEAEMATRALYFRDVLPWLLCPIKSLTFCNPINKVQSTAGENRAGESIEHSSEYLLKCFLKGERINVTLFDGFTPNACHQEVKLMSAVAKAASPKVSVIIPCFNQANYLAEAVQSVAAQTFTDWECIIVNDGSPDDTSAVARRLISMFPEKNFRLLEKKNGGLPDARNAGIIASYGRYWLPLDADDRIEPTFLEKAVKILDERSEVGFVYSHIGHFGIQNDVYIIPNFDANTIVHSDNIACVCSLVRRIVWDQVGGYNIDMREGYEDWDFWIGCIDKGWKGHRIPEPLFLYRKRDGSMLERSNRKRERLVARIVCNHPALYSNQRLQNAQKILSDNRAEPGNPRILIVCSHFWPSIGGLETIVEQLSSNLVLAGYYVSVLTSAVPGRTADTYRGVNIISRDAIKLINGIPEWLLCIRSEVESGRYAACILIQDPQGPIIWSMEDIVVPKQTHLFIQPIINADGYSHWKDNVSFRDRLKKILLNATAAITISRSGPDDAYMHSEGIKPVYIPNSVSIPKPSMDFRSKFGIPDSTFLILHVANLYWVKNHVGLLNTLGNLTSDWKLVMIGQPSGERECAQHFHEALKAFSEVLYIPGLPPEDVSAAMEAADVIVLASHGEGSPVTILEAMAHGKPWLATPNCGAANDNAGGIICRLEEFPDYLHVLSSDVTFKNSLGEIGSLHWKKCFTWPVVIEGWIDLIERGKLQQSFEMPSEIKAAMEHIKNYLSSKVKQTANFVLPESRHAHHWLDGLRGLEIGPSAQNPFGLDTRYVGRRDEIYEDEQLRLTGSAVSLDIEALADNIPAPNESEDFILSSHVIVHCPNVITTLLEWFRIVRKGGIIYMIVPLQNAALSDMGKEITSWRHILDDFKNQANEHSEPEAGNFGHCHYHVFSIDSMRKIVENVFGDHLQLVDYMEKDDKVGNGFTLVYRKGVSITETILWPFWEQFSAKAPDKKKIVNICMVTFNRLEFTRQAIDALVEYTDYPYVLTVVDNNSQDGSKNYLHRLKDRGVIKNLVLLDENIGIAKASNLAWSMEPEAEYYLKLDNDIVIKKENWLSDMVRVIEGIPQIGAVAYNFEPVSYPLTDLNNIQVRVKTANLGGACFLITARTCDSIGYWCEDYGLYSEEDYDYCYRMTLAGIQYAYMEDENIGIHLPAGKAAKINYETIEARDGVEEVHQRDYRLWKDETRRQVIENGIRDRNIIAYQNGKKPLYASSECLSKWSGNGRPGLVASLAQTPRAAQPLEIAVFSYDSKEHACGHYRIQAPLKELAGQVELSWGIEVRENAFHIISGVAEAADIIVVQRSFPRSETADFLYYLCSLGKPIIFEIDDLLTQIPPTNLNYGWGMDCTPHIYELMRKCSAVTVTTEELKKHFTSYSDAIYILPNLLDSDLWCKKSPPSSGPVVIGYTGTITHNTDLALLEEVFDRIASSCGNRVTFTFMGCATERISKLPGFSFIQFENSFEAYARKLQEIPIDIMLAPLEDNPFNRCKSNIKWLEYSSCGIAGVYADLPPYNNCIGHGTTGLLAGNDPQQWFDAIDLLIKNPELRSTIAMNARQKVITEHTVKMWAQRWLQVYQEIISLHATRNATSIGDLSEPSKIDAQGG